MLPNIDEPEMFKHLAFFDALSAEEVDGGTQWLLLVIGYFIMRWFDDWSTRGPAAFSVDGGAERVLSMLDDARLRSNPYTSVFRDILRALKSSPDWNAFSGVAPLLAYAGLLEADSKWTLAADVYGSVANALNENELTGQPDITSAGFARRKQAFTLRHMGDFDGAERAYNQAIIGAMHNGDALTVHYSKLGLVNLKRIKGNLPDALNDLHTLLREAQDSPHDIVSHAVADILNARGAISHERGEYDQAILDFYEAYRQSLNIDTQNQCLTDLAACAIRKCYYVFADHALHLVLHRCDVEHRRQFAIINLMQLAVTQHKQATFHQLRSQWQPAISDTLLNASARLIIAQGIEQFGTPDEAKQAYEEAASFARQERIHKVQFDALERLKMLTHNSLTETSSRGAIAPAALPASLIGAADAIANERELLLGKLGC